MSNDTSKDWMVELITILKKLRSEQGCPWDREQTHTTIKSCLIEECAELLDAIDDKDDDGICEELGDVLLQIVFHSQIATEEGRFTFDDVARNISEKLVRRHPHVFGSDSAETPDDVLKIWKKVKRTEKDDPENRFDRIPRHLPSLMRATEYQKKVAKVGFDWSSQNQILDKISEEIDEIKEAMLSGDEKAIDEEIGDLLFAVVNLARFRNRTPAEELLAKAIYKFKTRFDFIEKELFLKNSTPEESNIEEMEELWNKAKEQERR